MSNSLTLKFWFDWWDSGTILFTSALQAVLARLYDNVAFSAVLCAGKFAKTFPGISFQKTLMAAKGEKLLFDPFERCSSFKCLSGC